MQGEQSAQFYPKIEPLPGSVQVELRRCGKAACRCASGQLHGPYFRHVQRIGGRTVRRYVPLGEAAAAAQACALHREQFPSGRQLARWWRGVKAQAEAASARRTTEEER